MRNRLEITTYDEVLAELKRPDLDGSGYLDKLPKADEVRQVLSDAAQVRYFVYTDTHIYELLIYTYSTPEELLIEDWDLIVIPKEVLNA